MLDIKDVLTKEELYILSLKYIEGKSATNISRVLDLNRLVITQTEKEALKKIEEFLLDREDDLDLFKKNEYINIGVLTDYLEDNLIIKIIESNKLDRIYYSDPLRRVYMDSFKAYRDRDKDIRRLLRKIDNYGYIDDLYMQLDYLGNMTKSDIDLLKKNINLKEIGDYYFLEKDRETNLLSVLLKKEYRKGFKLTKDNLVLLRDRSQELTGEKFTSKNIDDLSKIFDGNKTIYQVYYREYYYYEYFPIYESDLKIIKDLIYKEWYGLEEGSYIYLEIIFEKLSEKTKNIKSIYHLIDIINYNLYEFYYIDEESLKIFRRKKSPISNEETIYRILVKEERPIKMGELSERLGITNKNIDYSLRSSTRLTKLGNKIYLVDQIETKESNETVYDDFIDKEFINGFSTGSLLFDKVTFDPEYNSYFKNKSIGNSKELTDYILKRTKTIKGNITYLYRENFQASSLDELLPLVFPEKLTRYEVYDYIESLMLPMETGRRLMRSLNTDYYQVGIDEYIHKDKFKIEDELISHISDLLLDYEYIAVNKFILENNISKNMTDYDINQFLITNILEEEGYKKLERNNENYVNEEIVMVKKISPYNSIDELVCDLLITDYQGKKLEEDIYDYLVKKGIYGYKENNRDKKLRRDLTYKGLITVDYAGRVYYGN